MLSKFNEIYLRSEIVENRASGRDSFFVFPKDDHSFEILEDSELI